jgi:hypothetical protein
MKYGVHVFGGAALRTKAAVQQIGQLADELGYDAIMTGDHITIPKQIVSTYPYEKQAEMLGDNPYTMFTNIDWLDVFTVLALLIPVTEKVRLGTSVTIIPYRHPLETARVVATLDVASCGRIILGAGIGWMTEEFRLLGITLQRTSGTNPRVRRGHEGGLEQRDPSLLRKVCPDRARSPLCAQTAAAAPPTDLGRRREHTSVEAGGRVRRRLAHRTSRSGGD